MRIRMKARAAGPRGVYFPGAVVRVPEDVDETTATAWLNGGFAEAVKVHDVERAVMPAPPEQAVVPAGNATRDEGPDLQTISGIGPATARRLIAAGIGSAGALARAEAGAVASAAGTSQERAAEWIREAEEIAPVSGA